MKISQVSGICLENSCPPPTPQLQLRSHHMQHSIWLGTGGDLNVDWHSIGSQTSLHWTVHQSSGGLNLQFTLSGARLDVLPKLVEM
jgi:hypothetical protein